MTTLTEIWHGFLTGLGVELSFFALWLIWTVLHVKVILKHVRPSHWIYIVAKYFE